MQALHPVGCNGHTCFWDTFGLLMAMDVLFVVFHASFSFIPASFSCGKGLRAHSRSHHSHPPVWEPPWLAESHEHAGCHGENGSWAHSDRWVFADFKLQKLVFRPRNQSTKTKGCFAICAMVQTWCMGDSKNYGLGLSFDTHETSWNQTIGSGFVLTTHFFSGSKIARTDPVTGTH